MTKKSNLTTTRAETYEKYSARWLFFIKMNFLTVLADLLMKTLHL